MVEAPEPFLKRKMGAGILQEHNSLTIIRFLLTPTLLPPIPETYFNTIIHSAVWQ